MTSYPVPSKVSVSGYWDVVIVGDEVESVLTAVSAARMGATTLLVRKAPVVSNPGLLGGLSTRGGLGYMDITLETKSPLFQEFLERAGVIRVALAPNKAHQVLEQLLEESGVQVENTQEILPVQETFQKGSSPELALLEEGKEFKKIKARCVVDTTPDANLMRALGVPFMRGLGELFGPENNFLGISPVFEIKNVAPEILIGLDKNFRTHEDFIPLMQQAFPFYPLSLLETYRARPCFCPAEEDYLDMLNPAIGVYFHFWLTGETSSYGKPSFPEVADSPCNTWIDGGNIARLPNKSLLFNGLVGKETDFETLLLLSQGNIIPQKFITAMARFETFLQQEGNAPQAKIIPPQSLYVRQTLLLKSRQNLSARQIIKGGVSPEHAIGTYSYWLDVRGIPLGRYFAEDEPLPKPIFNVGLDVAFSEQENFENVAFVSRSAGYSPLSQGACRIVQHNAMLGEAIGIAAALASQQDRPFNQVSAQEIQPVLQQRYHAQGRAFKLSGVATWPPEKLQKSPILTKDEAILAKFFGHQNTANNNVPKT